MTFSFRRTKRDDDTIIKQVIALADSNKKTLGFLPASAIKERCQNGDTFVCLQGGNVAGYILFSHLKRTHVIRIHHFCIAKGMRRSGIATSLFNKFKKTIHGAFYIELSCRDDYEINSFWNQLGFNIVKAREGRAVNELSVLHLFRYPLQKNILDIIDDIDTRPRVLLDASTVFDFDLELRGFTEKNSLLVFSNNVRFCVAPVIFEDMQRQQDEAVKRLSLEKVNRFKTLSIPSDHSAELCERLANEFPLVRLSDRKQLTCAIANNVRCFITNDRQLLELFQQFADNYGIMIYSPAEFYHNIDSVLSREVIQTELLPSTHGKLVDTRLNETALCNNFLNTAQGEKRHEFVGKLKKNLKNSVLKSINIANEDYGILYYSVEKETLTVHLLRTVMKPSNFRRIATAFILGELIQIATRHGITLIHLDDAHAPAEVASAGTQLGFLENKKLSLRYSGTMEGYRSFAQKTLPQDVFHDVHNSFGELMEMNDAYAQVAAERKFFPAKFTDIDIPTYILPIRALWARDLITPQVIGQHGLFASDTGNVLMHDLNVYYTSTKACIATPGRILWYVTDNSKRNLHVMWPKHIIATSYLDEVHSGTKEEIFKKFWKIGVYKWADIGNMLSKSCTAMLFSRTEIFTSKVPYSAIADIIRRKMDKGFTPITATAVSNDVFFDIYDQGHKNGDT